MLIPSIDIEGGRVVQLVRGEQVALSYDDPGPWIEKFAHFPRVQLIDLDAAKGTGSNRELVRHIASCLPAQVGGGIRTPDDAHALLSAGAQAVIIGSVLFNSEGETPVRQDVAETFARQIGVERLIYSVDAKAGNVAIRGWRGIVPITPAEAIRALEPWCAAFLYTHIDVEGTMAGFPTERARELAGITRRKLIVAGGIRAMSEVMALDALGVDAVVGMALYCGSL